MIAHLRSRKLKSSCLELGVDQAAWVALLFVQHDTLSGELPDSDRGNGMPQFNVTMVGFC